MLFYINENRKTRFSCLNENILGQKPSLKQNHYIIFFFIVKKETIKYCLSQSKVHMKTILLEKTLMQLLHARNNVNAHYTGT